MKKLFLLSFCLIFFLATKAQTFSNITGGIIQEVGITNEYPIVVAGLTASIDSSTYGLIQICWNITHTYDSDLDIKLESPDGTIILLSNNNGDEYNNFINTCVQEDASDGEISEASAPFNGDFYPDESVNHLNNGQDANGTWYLIVIDEAPGDTGHVSNVSLTFSNNPPPTHPGGPCTTSNSVGCLCPDSSSIECDLLPDMINSVKYIETHWTEHPGYLRLGVATPNIGSGPLEMHSTGECYCDTVLVNCFSQCSDGSSPKEKVKQTIYHKNGSTMTTYTISAGTMTYHDNHGHIHVDNWTDNTLRIRGADPDPRTWPIIAKSDKVSFCLVNLGTCTTGNEYCVNSGGTIIDKNDLANGGLGSVSGCGYDQGIYVGKYDAYDQYLDGQEIDFGEICDGEYYIVSITDPLNVVKETDDNDNVAAVLIKLDEQQGSCCASAFHADTTFGFAPFEVQFIDSTVPVADSWIWNFGDGSTSTDQFPQHVYTQPGIYTVTSIVTTSAGCIDTIVHEEYITVVLGTGSSSMHDPKTIQLQSFPNPFHSSTSVSLNLENTAFLHMYLTDVVGNIVKTYWNGYHHSGKQQFTIDVLKDKLTNGIYFIHAEIEGKDYVLKLVQL